MSLAMALSYRPTTLTGDRLLPGYDYIAPSAEPDPFVMEQPRRVGATFVAVLKRPPVIALLLLFASTAFFNPTAAAILVAFTLFVLRAGADPLTPANWSPQFLEALGLAPLANYALPQLTPVLRKSTSSGLPRGTLYGGEDDRRQLLRVNGWSSGDGEDGASKQFSNGSITALHFRVPLALGLPYVGASPVLTRGERFADMPLASLTAGPRRGVNAFSVESLGLHDRFHLRCTTGSEGVARRAFSPSFIVWFAVHGLPFECEHGHLTVYVPYPLTHLVQFREFLSRADHIYAELAGQTELGGQVPDATQR